MLSFNKYQGTGNDFIMIDDRTGTFDLNQPQIEFLCDRRFGIGADGLILLQKAEGFDFRMVYFNADGREGSMCGNGGRCTVRFAHDLGVFDESTSFIAVDGPHEANVHGEIVSLKMSDVEGSKEMGGSRFYNTGSPHVVKYVTDIDNFDVVAEGKAIRYSDFWQEKGGTNVNFVEVIDDLNIKVRTYERGVEDETYSCGTGVTACALDRFTERALTSPVKILTKGGELEVSYNAEKSGSFSEIWLSGPAIQVFVGKIDV